MPEGKSSSWKCQRIPPRGRCFCCWASAQSASAQIWSSDGVGHSDVTCRWRNARLATVWVWVRPSAFRLVWEDLAVPWWKEIQPSIMNATSDRSQSDDAALDLDCACTIERKSHWFQLVFCRCTCKVDTAQLPTWGQQLLSVLNYLIADRVKKLEQHGANRHCELLLRPKVLLCGIEWFGSRVESGRCG